MFDNCLCGCDADTHHTPEHGEGGPCPNHMHCQYYEIGDYGGLEATNQGQQDYIDNAPRRWFW